MIDAGTIHPDSALGPLRSASGQTTLGRLTTTDEQYAQALEQMTEVATRSGLKSPEVRATVHWSRGEPTVLDVRFLQEHIGPEAVYIPDRVVESTLSGGEIQRSEESRLNRLNDELLELHRSGMI